MRVPRSVPPTPRPLRRASTGPRPTRLGQGSTVCVARLRKPRDESSRVTSEARRNDSSAQRDEPDCGGSLLGGSLFFFSAQAESFLGATLQRPPPPRGGGRPIFAGGTCGITAEVLSGRQARFDDVEPWIAPHVCIQCHSV